ncbi:K02A2.6-like [Cordylochernes scorpioides]|uniref:RNA-directed DNA polymerase n=1 Tax=Cordylochernes scorpioides TaxID=51811 RepID=A0ABY6LSC6_9ARAC|nr:K02A2.6-like [Cordylochernes scorpioides]
MSAILRGVNGVICHMDDILIFAKRKEEHDETLREVLRRLKNSGITLNKEKCQFGVSNVTFLGHYIDEHGIKADEKKVKAIAEMKPPTDVHGVQRFMGMVNFLGRFVPNLAEITKPLNDLRKKDVSFIWGSPQKKAFEKVKDVLASDRVLASFDISKKSMVSADASSYGLGAVLKQEHEANEWRPVAFASRTMTKTEQGYAQIEKEALAITWACERFKDFVVGKTFLIETDHKPLVPIFTTKDLNDLTPRLQRYRMRMLQFSFHIFHTPGKDLITADALSRQPLPGHLPEDEELQEEVEHFVRSIVLHQSTTDERLVKIALNQKLEPTLQNVAFYSKNGWPAKCQLSPLERSFYDVRDEIGEENGLLMRGLRVIIPSTMRKDVLNRVHAGHQGITKCRARAKDHVWWPGIGQEIQDMVKTCDKCIENQPLKHEPLIPNDFPERPWQKVGMDLFHYEGSEYLVVVDYFSRFIEVVRLTKLSSEAVVDQCKAIFARHGIPDIVISDNGPQFRPSTTSAFTKFASEVGFRHITSSPKHPQSNGQAEAALKIVKNLMKKNKDPVLALMEYRATPLANGLSPAELLFGRKIRTMVPCTSSSLTPKTVDQSKLRGEEEQRKMAQKTAFDRRHATTKKAELIAGEKVWVKDLRAWGSVLEKASAPRSYIVETPVGTYRRNSLLLASSQQQVDPSETSPDSELPAETEETPGNELPAEEQQQLPAIAPEIKQLSPSPGKVSRCLHTSPTQQQQYPLSWVCKAAALGLSKFSERLRPLLGMRICGMEPGLHHHILSCMGLKDEREVLLSEIGLEGLSLELLLNEVVRNRAGTCTETSETLHWTRQQQQYSIHTQDREHCDCCDRDVRRQLRLFIGHDNNNNTVYTPKIENDCCDRDVRRHLRLFIGHDNNNNTVYTPKIENSCCDRDVRRHLRIFIGHDNNNNTVYTPKIENDCCDRDVRRHLRLFIGHDNNNNTVYTPKIENSCCDRDVRRHLRIFIGHDNNNNTVYTPKIENDCCDRGVRRYLRLFIGHNYNNNTVYTSKIENDCCDRDVRRHLRLFIGHDNNNNTVYTSKIENDCCDRDCNGLVERANATIISKLRLHHQQNPRIPWPKLLQKALEEYRSIPHSITKMPPVYLLFGITPSYINNLTRAYPPIEEARRIANENTGKLHLKLVKRYNESHKTPNLKIGDEVFYKIPYQSGQGKLMPAFYPEPYTIISIPSPQTIEIDKPCQPENKHATIVNISKVKLWDPVTEDNTEPPFPFQEEEDLEGCLGVEPNKQASTDSPQVLFSSIKEKKSRSPHRAPGETTAGFGRHPN